MPEDPINQSRLQNTLDKLVAALSGIMILLLPDFAAALVAAYLLLSGVTGVLVLDNSLDDVPAPLVPIPH